MKKVLIIGLTERVGGVETFIYNTTIFSNKDKYQFDYLVHGSDHCVFQNEINNFYGTGNHFYFITNLKRNPIKCIFELYSFYKKHREYYDVIHLETGFNTEVMYMFPYIIFCKAKAVIHSHSSRGKHPKINKMLKPIVNAMADRRVSCSNVATEWLFGKNYVSTTEIINNGIDTERFIFNKGQRKKIRNAYEIKDNELVIGHIGRFSHAKNHEFIIEVFEKIVLLNENSRLLLVGVGEKEKIIKKLCEVKGIANKVIFAGRQNNTNEYYSAFDVFLMPSLFEGLPVVGIEAQSEGLPCYFSNTIDRQIIITDTAHMLSLEDSPSKWASTILNNGLNLSRHDYNIKVRNSGYDIKDTVRRIEEVYDEITRK